MFSSSQQHVGTPDATMEQGLIGQADLPPATAHTAEENNVMEETVDNVNGGVSDNPMEEFDESPPLIFEPVPFQFHLPQAFTNDVPDWGFYGDADPASPDFSAESFASDADDHVDQLETIPFHHRRQASSAGGTSAPGNSETGAMRSWRQPTLRECKEILQSKETVVACLEDLLEINGHVTHIGEWLLFLLCAGDADDHVIGLDFEDQAVWCQKHLEATISSAPQRVCPKSFTAGDIVWNCESCQRDATCVQCQQCFSESNHEGHEVYFYQVGVTGGGCCDCGDDQAWNPAGFCSRHGSNSTLGSFPHDMRRSAEIIIGHLARWIADNCLFVANMLKNRSGPVQLDVECLFQVLGQHDPWSAPPDSTIVFPTKSAPLNKLPEIEGYLEELVKHGSSIGRLRIYFRHPEYRTYNRVAKVVEALHGITHTSDALVRILCDSLTENHDLSLIERARMAASRKQSVRERGVLEDLIIADPLLPEFVSGPLHLLYMRLLTDAAFKERYAVAFAETYVATTMASTDAPQIITSRPPVTTSDQGIFGLSVQFLNRENFVNVLMREYDFIQDLLDAWSFILNKGNVEDPPPTFNHTVPAMQTRAYRHAITDMKYIIQCPTSSRYFCFERPDLLAQWIRLLTKTQGMDPVERIPVGYPAAPFESEDWIHAVFLMMNTSLCSGYLLRCLSLEEDSDWDFAHRPEFTDCVLEFSSLLDQYIEAATLVLRANVGDDNRRVSFNLPVYRFVTMAITSASAAMYSVTQDNTAAMAPLCMISAQSCRDMVSASLHTLAACAQIRNRMWVRNGLSVTNRNLNYERGTTVKYTHDQDFRSLQLFATQLSAEELIEMTLKVFGVDTSLGSSSSSSGLSSDSTPKDPDWEYHPVMSEALLELLISTATEMPFSCTKQMPKVRDILEEELERTLVHRLAEGPLPFTPISDIAASVPEVIKFSEEDVRRVLERISVARSSSDGLGAILFDLVDDAWLRFDPNFSFQMREQREKARERWMESRARLAKKQGQSEAAHGHPICPVPPSYMAPVFLQTRQKILRAAFPVAAKAFILAKTAFLDVGGKLLTAWPSVVTLPSLQLLTLLIHASSTREDYEVWTRDPASSSLLDSLVHVASMVPAPPFDQVVQDGVKWVLRRVTEASEEFAKRFRSRTTLSEASETRQGDQDSSLGNSGGGGEAMDDVGAIKSTSAKKKVKRNRAQEKIMAAMRAATLRAGEQFADFDVDAEEPPTSKTKHNESSMLGSDGESAASRLERLVSIIPDPDCCICRSADSQKILATLGFGQTSSVLIENQVDSHLPIWDDDSRRIVTQCGHAMHAECFKSWRDSALTSLSELRLATVEDRSAEEFLCPLCKTVCNVLVPYHRMCNPAVWETPLNGQSHSFSSDVAMREDHMQPSVEGVQGLDFEMFTHNELVCIRDAPASKAKAKVEAESAKVLAYLSFCSDFLHKLQLSSFSPFVEFNNPTRRAVEENIGVFWIGTTTYILANPLDTTAAATTRWRNAIQAALSLARCFPLDSVVDSLRSYWSIHIGNDLARSCPEMSAGLSYLLILLVRTYEIEGLDESDGLLRRRIDSMLYHWFVIKTIQSLIDPLSSVESDSVLGEVWDVTGTKKPMVMLSPFASSYSSEPVTEEEVRTLSDIRQAFFDAFRSQWGMDLSVRGDLEWREGEELVRWTRKQVAPFLELCKALRSAQRSVAPSKSTSGSAEEEQIQSRWMHQLTRDVIQAQKLARVLATVESMEVFFNMGDSGTMQTEETLSMDAVVSSSSSSSSIRPIPLSRRLLSPHPVRVRQLVTLPTEYTELFACAQMGATCSKCNRPGHEKAVCLVCGELVLAAADCARTMPRGEGPCTIHAKQRHDGICLFFVIQRCQVLLVNGIKSALFPSLYVDKNGEERSGPQRGLPLRLDPRRMARLQQMFASHAIPDEVAISRGTTDGFLRDWYF